MADTKNKSHYISNKESRLIAKENRKITKKLEKRKKRKNVEAEYLTEMKDSSNIIEFDNLHTYFFTDTGTVKAVNGVTFSIPAGSTVGVVGESGCGKSVTSLSTMQLVQGPTGQIVDGSIRFRTKAFRRDGKGKKIPVYETEVVDGVEVVKKDEKGKPIPIPYGLEVNTVAEKARWDGALLRRNNRKSRKESRFVRKTNLADICTKWTKKCTISPKCLWKQCVPFADGKFL